ncbi:MAG: hypothetical protein ABJB11_22810 [Ferruginibacter sp.]
MSATHLTETELQQYVVEPELISKQLMAHVQVCTICQTKSANYALLINGMQEAAKPAFNFDVSVLVLNRLPVPKRSFPWATIIISLLSVALIAIVVVLFGSAMVTLFRGVSGIILTIMMGIAFVFVIFQAIEIVREYNRRMDFVTGEKTLQL